jgi:hypothetical protein
MLQSRDPEAVGKAYPTGLACGLLIAGILLGSLVNAVVHNGMLDPGVRLLSNYFTVSDLARELQAALEKKRRR